MRISRRGSVLCLRAFPDVSATGLNEKDFAVGLLQSEKVAMSPRHPPSVPNGSGFCAQPASPPATNNSSKPAPASNRHVQSLTKRK